MQQNTKYQQRVTQILYSGLGGHGGVVFSLIHADKWNYFRHSLLFYGIEQTRQAYLEEAAFLRVPQTSILKKKGIDLGSWRKVYHALKKDQPNTVLLHSTNLIFPVWWFCKRSKAKLVVIEHTSNSVKRKTDHFFSRWSHRLANKVVLLTEAYKKEYQQIYKYRDTKLSIINNGIDVEKFIPNKFIALAPSMKIITMIGRFSEQKDQLTLIQAFQLLNQQDVVLKLAGSGNQLARCEAYVQEHDLSDQVIFTGLLNESEIISLLQETTIYVHASLGETMPISLMQAMACQLPVIGSDISGINDLIDPEKDGLLFEKSNINQLAEQLNRLINDLDLRQELAKKVREKAQNEFSHFRMFEAYKTVIESL